MNLFIDNKSGAPIYEQLYTCLLYTSDAADETRECRSRWSPYH